ncbi:MAG: hypothetical protein ACPGSD_16475 [Flavobacteriales bacterium]
MIKIYISIILFIGLLISCSEQPKQIIAPATKSIEADSVLTFSEHISPIIYNNCVECHHEKGGAPFSLTNYHDVAKRSRMIAYVTAEKYMPPWPANKSYSTFLGEKGLTDKEIKQIRTWHKQGALQGDPALEAKLPQQVNAKKQKPDLVVKMPAQIPIKGDNLDRFLIAKLPYTIPQDTFVRMIEFVPGNRRFVHHVNGHLIRYLKPKDLSKGKNWVDREIYTQMEAYKAMDFPYKDGTFPTLTPSAFNYLPGVQPVKYPEGIGGFKLSKKGIFYLNDVHYGPSPIDTFDQSYVNIYFADKAPKRPLREFILGTVGVSPVVPPLRIPPNTVKSFRTEVTLQGDVSLVTINPHMHLLGKSMKAYAITPQSDTIPIIHIEDWNFRWQFFYTFEKLLVLQKGTTIIVEATFDNTTDNLDNPFDPPRLVTDREGSMKTTDEMFQFIVNYLPYKKGDENISLGVEE